MDLLGGLGVLVHVAKTGSFSAVARERWQRSLTKFRN